MLETVPQARSLLVLRHEPAEQLGHFEQTLRHHCVEYAYADFYDHLDLGSHNGLMVMGGPQSANDPALAAELRFIEQLIEANVPVLGICLGAQLIAKALGAEVYQNREKEIGWAPVYFDAAEDPVLGGLPSPAKFFHWHRETFTLPLGADWLAWSRKCRQQAFRYRKSVYGIQFHPEVTPEIILDWSADALDEPLEPHATDTAPLARQIIEGWLSTF